MIMIIIMIVMSGVLHHRASRGDPLRGLLPRLRRRSPRLEVGDGAAAVSGVRGGHALGAQGGREAARLEGQDRAPARGRGAGRRGPRLETRVPLRRQRTTTKIAAFVCGIHHLPTRFSRESKDPECETSVRKAAAYIYLSSLSGYLSICLPTSLDLRPCGMK